MGCLTVSSTTFWTPEPPDILVATGGGLFRFVPRGRPTNPLRPSFSEVRLPDAPPLPEVEVLMRSRLQEIWCGTSRGLYRISPKNQFAVARVRVAEAEEKGQLEPLWRAVTARCGWAFGTTCCDFGTAGSRSFTMPLTAP
jgi:hypothetical protein